MPACKRFDDAAVTVCTSLWDLGYTRAGRICDGCAGLITNDRFLGVVSSSARIPGAKALIVKKLEFGALYGLSLRFTNATADPDVESASLPFVKWRIRFIDFWRDDEGVVGKRPTAQEKFRVNAR